VRCTPRLTMRKAVPFITLILPAYNEVAQISETIRKARRYFEKRQYRHEIIVAADGDDGTREVVREIAQTATTVSVIGSSVRLGKGYGIREAVKLAQGDFIGFADADDKTPIEELDKFLVHLLDDQDLVIGSRAERESRIEKPQPFHRRVGSKAFACVMHSVVGLRDIKDTQCGFKFFRSSVAQELFRHQRIDGYMFDVEILYLARKMGYRIAQVPVLWRDDADSRLELFSGNLRNGIDLLRVPLLHRFGGSHAKRIPQMTPIESLSQEKRGR